MSSDLYDLSLQPYFESFWSSLRLAADRTFLWSPSFLVGCVIATSAVVLMVSSVVSGPEVRAELREPGLADPVDYSSHLG